MWKIERIIMIKTIDDDGELVTDVESDYFKQFSKQGLPSFDFYNAKEFEDREEAQAIVEQLRSLYGNSKNPFERVYFEIREVQGA